MNRKQLLAFLLVAVMTVSLCSCSSKPGAAPAPTESTVAEASTAADTSAATDTEPAASMEEAPAQADTPETDPDEVPADAPVASVVSEPMAVNILSSFDHIENEDYDPNAVDGADSIYNLMTLKYQYPEILTSGYDALKASLSEYQLAQEKHIAELKITGKDTIDSVEKADYEGIGFPWANEYTVTMARADNAVFSFWESFYYDEGGVHPTYTSGCINYDAQTGKQLSLDDVVKDKDALYEYVINELKAIKEERGIDDSFEETVKSLFHPATEADPSLIWALDKDGFDVHFNVYDIAPYAAGPFDIVIPYDKCSDYIKETYIRNTEATVKAVPEYTSIYFDANGDGTEEELYLEIQASEEQNNFILSISYGEPGNTKTIEKEAYIQYDKSYLLKNENGNYYLYVQAIENNDWEYLMMFDLSDPKSGPVAIEDDFLDSFYSFAPTDADHLYLSRRMEALGTRSGYREFKVGSDGIPVGIQNAYAILPRWNVTYDLTAKQDITGEDGTIATGESLTVISASLDEKGDATTILVRKQDGTEVTLKLDPRSEETFGENINGVNVEDLFDGLIYAG